MHTKRHSRYLVDDKRSRDFIRTVRYPYQINKSGVISNGNWTEWSTVKDDLRLLARLPLNCTRRSPVINQFCKQ